MTKPIIVSIEGNIGAGKTTILKNLKIMYYTDPSVIFLREPVDIWQSIKDKNDETILAKFYNDPKKYAFSFQVMAFMTRLTLLRETIEENPNCRMIICERSLEADRYIFAQMLYDDGLIDDVNFQIYMRFYNEYRHLYALDGIVYISANADICHQRIEKRGRVGETISIHYLKNCEKYHNHWLDNDMIQKCKLLKINTEKDVCTDDFTFAGLEWLEQIRQFCQELIG